MVPPNCLKLSNERLLAGGLSEFPNMSTVTVPACHRGIQTRQAAPPPAAIVRIDFSLLTAWEACSGVHNSACRCSGCTTLARIVPRSRSLSNLHRHFLEDVSGAFSASSGEAVQRRQCLFLVDGSLLHRKKPGFSQFVWCFRKFFSSIFFRLIELFFLAQGSL